MKKKVAVDDSLLNVKKLLTREGFEVIDNSAYGDASAVVVTGLDNNMMNTQKINTEAPVIDASGKSPEEIVTEVKEKMELM